MSEPQRPIRVVHVTNAEEFQQFMAECRMLLVLPDTTNFAEALAKVKKLDWDEPPKYTDLELAKAYEQIMDDRANNVLPEWRIKL